MKTQRLILEQVFLFCFLLSFSVQTKAQEAITQSFSAYNEQWKQVNEMIEVDRPKSALELVEAIKEQALAENNSIQQVKAGVMTIKLATRIDSDQFFNLLKAFEATTAGFTDETMKALSKSILAEFYLNYYQRERNTIGRRTHVNNVIPASLSEWTRQNFVDTIRCLLAESLVPAKQLQTQPVQTILDVLTGHTIQFEPTMYDVLAKRRISLLELMRQQEYDRILATAPSGLFAPAEQFIGFQLNTPSYSEWDRDIVETFQGWLAFRLKEGNPTACLYADLYRLKTLYNMAFRDRVFDYQKPLHPTSSLHQYVKTLQELSERYADNEFVLIAYHEQATFYMNFHKEDDPLFNDYKYKALKLTEKGLSRFPQSLYNKELKLLQEQITQPGIAYTSNAVVKRKTPLKVDVTAQNTHSAELTVYRINLTAKDFVVKRFGDNDVENDCTVLEKRTLTFNRDTLFNPVKTTFDIKGLDYGQYGYSLQIPGEKTRMAYFVVSDMASIDKNNNTELFVVDRVSGKPLADVQVQIYHRSQTRSDIDFSKAVASGKTDKDGFFSYELKANSTNYFFYERGADCHLYAENTGYMPLNYEVARDNVQISILKDRSLYRPGQTVYFKGIVYEVNPGNQRILPNKSYEVELMDANYQSVSKQTFTTNAYGSFSGSFVLPDAGLSGSYSIRCNGKNVSYFRVEEYKRPTFRVELKKPETALELGEAITITGVTNAFAGYPVTGANVTYKVTREPDYRMRIPNPTAETIKSDKTETGQDGTFTISFPAERIKDWEGAQVINFSIRATVTDQKGETHNDYIYVTVGDKMLDIKTMLGEEASIDKNIGRPIEVYVRTLNGAELPADVKYELYLLSLSSDFIDSEDGMNYNESREIEQKAKSQRKRVRLAASGSMNTKDGPLKLDFNKLTVGQYQLVCTTIDAKGRQEESISEFILYSPDDKHMPLKAHAWMPIINHKFAPGKPAVIPFGTADKHVYVLYRIMNGQTCLKSSWVRMSNELKAFILPYEERFGTGVTVEFTFIKDEKLYTRSEYVVYDYERRVLTPELSVFRNKLQPGEAAEWTITVPELKTLNKTAEVLAYMYDASLDMIYRHDLGFYPELYPSLPYVRKWNIITPKSETVTQLVDNYFPYIEMRTVFFGEPALVGGLTFSEPIFGVRTRGSSMPQREVSMAAQTLKFGEIESLQVGSVDESLQGRIAGLDIVLNSADPGVKQPSPFTPRRIFNETAFFYPQLLTDEAGNVNISFIVPESLTRWNVNLLAHTQDMYFGKCSTTVETQKDLMVQLNLPRFVRQSDKPVLSATVVNLGDKPLTTNVTLEILNPEDEKPLAGSLAGAATQTISLAPGETKAISWNLNALMSTELVICKVVASAGSFSDGEQNYLPVLPDKQLVTETLPLTVSVNKTKTYTLEKVAKPAQGLTPYALTVEFSPNPTWTAVQALPSLADPTNDNAIDYFTALYVSSLAAHIVQGYPKLTAVFEQWKQTGSNSAFLSTLSKNQQLKTLLLEETPWVVAAKDETEQRRELALLFDLNRQKNKQTENVEKLIRLQDYSGGFSWFESMPVDRYVTYYILLNQARLNAIVNPDAAPDNIFMRALEYADKTIANDYEQLKRLPNVDLSAMQIGDFQWFYLHLRSMYPMVALPEASKEAVAYYTKQAETHWTKASLYGKAATALIAARDGNKTLAAAILTALKEQALSKEDMGMYWAANKAGYGWSERPVMVQTLLLEAFTELGQSTATLDAMKTWLLRQKQTQRWDSPLSTVNAIYALLHYGQDWFGSTNEVSLKLGEVTVPTTSKEIGTGYIQHTYQAADIKPSMGNITVGLKSVSAAPGSIGTSGSGTASSGIGWGAVYYQFYQNIDQIKARGDGLSVKKQLFVEQTSSTETVMVPVSGQRLKPGDKVITRLIVSVDRTMDYVLLKDQRAACFEPVKQLSGYVWSEGVGYYQTSKDVSTQFFFSTLPKGNYVFEYAVYVNNAGTFTDGVATLQCLYAPEFSAHSGGGSIEVKPAGK